MKHKSQLIICAMFLTTIIISGCNTGNKPTADHDEDKIEIDRFADIRILRYKIPGFDSLTLQQKKLAYYLYQAALSGRDIFYDQKYKYNLRVRRVIEDIYGTYSGNRNSDDFQKFVVYAKRVWFSNGIHHHYSGMKIIPDFSFEYFSDLVKKADPDKLPLDSGQSVDQLLAMLHPIMFDKNVDFKHVNLDKGVDHVAGSANNFYGEGITQPEVEAYYDKLINKDDKEPIPVGLNSKIIKENGLLVGKTWKIGSMYSAAIEKIVYWLQQAVTVSENAQQKDALEKLVKFYQTGSLQDFDDYNIAWVKDVNSMIDNVNGFIEVYEDPLGKKGAWEAIVSVKDLEATKIIAKIGSEAQWFEDHSPIMKEHKKESVKGITGKSINVIVESGDAAPSTPIGINLPNTEWIREEYGSKSVSLGNIVSSYNYIKSQGKDVDEFAYNDEIKDRIKKYGGLAGELHTDMHEVIGHASGKLNPGVATPDQTLKTYHNTLEEARADLVGLYYIMDPKLVEIGVMPTLEVGKTEYDIYVMNGMMLQLNRIEPGDNLEEAHMRNRQMIVHWAYEHGKKDNVIERIDKDGKTYFKINDYNKLRDLFGQLLREIQRIKSEGDYASAQNLVETYGVKVDQDLLKQVKQRFAKLNIAPYMGFIQPKLVPVMNGNDITDVKVEYPDDFAAQMMEYGKEYSFLPWNN